MINKYINELVNYGLKAGLVVDADKVYVTNRLLELFGLLEFEEEAIDNERELVDILEDMMVYAHENGILEEDTITMKDLFDTKIMGMLTPAPSVVRANFDGIYKTTNGR